MSKKNVYEILDEFKAATNKAERIDVLRNNDGFALRNVLVGVFHPNVKYSITDIPQFKREKMPAGMAYGNMSQALQRIYLFMQDNPRVPAGLAEKRKSELLIQILESLEEQEADVFIGILKKDLKVPYLTPSLINEALGEIIPTPKKQ